MIHEGEGAYFVCSGMVRSLGAGFKLFYHGVDGKRNGVTVTLKEELVLQCSGGDKSVKSDEF